MATQEQYRKNASYAQVRAEKCKTALTRGLWLESAEFWQRLDAQDEHESARKHNAPKRRKARIKTAV
jgi:hypothetical protein